MCEKVLTISIAAYNSEEYIKKCLDSVLRCKNYEKLEIFVTDDGGIDKTLAIAKEYADKYPNVIIPVHKENGGWGSTVNYSIDHATGRYFKILDADDKFNTGEIDDYIDFLSKSDFDLIVTPYIEHNVLNNFDKYVNDKMLQMHNFTVRTKLLKNNKVVITEKCYYTDVEFVFLCLDVIKSYSNYDRYIYIYNVGFKTQSVDNSQFIKHVDEHEIVCKRVIEIYDENLNRNLVIDKKIIFDRLIELIYKHYSVLFMLKISNSSLNKIEEFDIYIKKYEYLYKNITLKRLKLIRNCNILYYPISLVLHFRSYIYNKVKAI